MAPSGECLANAPCRPRTEAAPSSSRTVGDCARRSLGAVKTELVEVVRTLARRWWQEERRERVVVVERDFLLLSSSSSTLTLRLSSLNDEP